MDVFSIFTTLIFLVFIDRPIKQKVFLLVLTIFNYKEIPFTFLIMRRLIISGIIMYVNRRESDSVTVLLDDNFHYEHGKQHCSDHILSSSVQPMSHQQPC